MSSSMITITFSMIVTTRSTSPRRLPNSYPPRCEPGDDPGSRTIRQLRLIVRTGIGLEPRGVCVAPASLGFAARTGLSLLFWEKHGSIRKAAGQYMCIRVFLENLVVGLQVYSFVSPFGASQKIRTRYCVGFPLVLMTFG